MRVRRWSVLKSGLFSSFPTSLSPHTSSKYSWSHQRSNKDMNPHQLAKCQLCLMERQPSPEAAHLETETGSLRGWPSAFSSSIHKQPCFCFFLLETLIKETRSTWFSVEPGKRFDKLLLGFICYYDRWKVQKKKNIIDWRKCGCLLKFRQRKRFAGCGHGEIDPGKEENTNTGRQRERERDGNVKLWKWVGGRDRKVHKPTESLWKESRRKSV